MPNNIHDGDNIYLSISSIFAMNYMYNTMNGIEAKKEFFITTQNVWLENGMVHNCCPELEMIINPCDSTQSIE